MTAANYRGTSIFADPDYVPDQAAPPGEDFPDLQQAFRRHIEERGFIGVISPRSIGCVLRF